MITVRFDGEISFDNEDAFPDGVPDNVTAEVVAEAMRNYGSKDRVLTDWALEEGVSVWVSVDRGAEVEVWS